MLDYTTIKLSKQGNKHKGKYETIVDTIDSDLANYRWIVRICRKTIYAYRWKNKNEKTHLHREILARKLKRDELLPHELVDHIDGNGLNNTRDNLRLATNSQNLFNRGKSVNNKSGYKGVSKIKNREKWIAQIAINGRNMNLGSFDTPELAYAAYCEKAKELYGEFANYGDKD